MSTLTILSRRPSVYLANFNLWQSPFILGIAALGLKVYVFDHPLSLRKNRIARYLLDTNCMTRIGAVNYPIGVSHTEAIQVASSIINHGFEKKIIKIFSGLVSEENAGLVFQRILAEALLEITTVRNYFSLSELKGKNTVFVPSRAWRLVDLAANHGFDISISKEIYTLGAGRIPALISDILNWIKLLGVISLYFFHFLQQKVVPKRCREKIQSYSYGISVPSAWAAKFLGSRRFDFLADGKTIKLDECVFLIEYQAPQDFYSTYRKSGHNLKRVQKANSILALFKRRALNICWTNLKSVLSITFFSLRPDYLSRAAVVLLAERLKWALTLTDCNFEKYVYFNKEGASQIAANCYFKSRKIISCNFLHFIGGPYQFSYPGTKFDSRNVIWSFLNSDYYFVPNRIILESMRSQYQNVREYQVTGNIFAEMIRQPSRQPASKKRLTENKTVAIFDTTYVDLPSHWSNLQEAEAFLKDITRLALRYQNIYFLFKPSKGDARFLDVKNPWYNRKTSPNIPKLRSNLAQLSNVQMLDDSADTVDIIRSADLVLTHAFSTPTADALAAGKRAFWYESSNKLRGHIYDSISGLFIHGYAELEAAFTSNHNILDIENSSQVFKELIDEFGDCCGLTRLREAIKSS